MTPRKLLPILDVLKSHGIMTTIWDILYSASVTLEDSGIPSHRLDAEVLLSHALKTDRLSLYLQPHRVVSDAVVADLQRWIARRKEGEPVAYIINCKEFWSLKLKVNPHVLVPRPETELLVEEALKIAAGHTGEYLRILEIGTGSGAISIALASEIPKATIVATDISKEALAMASINARVYDLQERVHFLASNLFDAMAGTFDIIVSNPPYIASGEFDRLPRDIRNFEPRVALHAGSDGTAFHRILIEEGSKRLESGGWLLMEFGDGQKDQIEGLLRNSVFYDTVYWREDYAGMPRVVKVRKRA